METSQEPTVEQVQEMENLRNGAFRHILLLENTNYDHHPCGESVAINFIRQKRDRTNNLVGCWGAPKQVQ